MTGFKSNEIFLRDIYIYIYIIYSNYLFEDIKNVIGQDNWNKICLINPWKCNLKTLEGY